MHLAFTLVSLLVGAPPTPRVAIAGLAGVGIDNSTVQSFERLLGRTVSEITGGTVVTPAAVDLALIDPGLSRMRDCSEASCLARIGAAVQAERVLYGTLTRLGSRYVISLRIVDVSERRELSRVEQQLSGPEGELIIALRGAVIQLIDPRSYRGALLVTCDVPCVIRLDGTAVTMSKGAVPATVGRHALTVSSPGRRELATMVEVRFGEVTRIVAELPPAEVQVLRVISSGWPTAAIAGGGVSLAAAGVLGWLTDREERRFTAAYERGDRSREFFTSSAARGESYATWTNVALGVGLALISTGAAGWWLDDEPAADSVGAEGQGPGAVQGAAP